MKDLKQFIQKAKDVNLREDEKAHTRSSILNFISQRPVRPDALPRLNPWSVIFTRNLSFVPTMAILLVISLMVGGGMAVGAQKALPGDALYPVKVGINEEVRGWMSVSDESKANWEIERAQRRLVEAEELAGEGRLSSEVREKIESNFELHAERVKTRIDKFEAKENFNAAASVSANFETSLKSHQKILRRLTAESKEEIKKEIKPIRIRLKSRTQNLIDTQKRIELRSGGKVNVELKADSDDDSELDKDLEINANINNKTIRNQVELKANLKLGN